MLSYIKFFMKTLDLFLGIGFNSKNFFDYLKILMHCSWNPNTKRFMYFSDLVPALRLVLEPEDVNRLSVWRPQGENERL